MAKTKELPPIAQRQCEIGRELIQLGKVLIETGQDAAGLSAAETAAYALGTRITDIRQEKESE